MAKQVTGPFTVDEVGSIAWELEDSGLLDETTRGGGDKATTVSSVFCAGWPSAAGILKLLAKSSNFWVKLAVSTLLQVGNELYKKCVV